MGKRCPPISEPFGLLIYGHNVVSRRLGEDVDQIGAFCMSPEFADVDTSRTTHVPEQAGCVRLFAASLYRNHPAGRFKFSAKVRQCGEQVTTGCAYLSPWSVQYELVVVVCVLGNAQCALPALVCTEDDDISLSYHPTPPP